MTSEEFSHIIMPMRPELLARAQAGATADQGAEDLVQETLLRLWGQRSKLASHPNPRALALLILRNLMRDHHRRRRLERGHATLPTGQAYSDPQPDVSSDLQLVARIVDSLPPLQQRIFRMKEMEGYGRDEIRQILGCTDESLRQNLSRARRRIKEEFIRLTAI